MKCETCGVALNSENTSHYRLTRNNARCYTCAPGNNRPHADTKKHQRYRAAMRAERPVQYSCQQMKDSSVKRARKLGWEHDLTTAFLMSIAPEVCPILGIKLEYGGGIKSDASASLDRMDNNKGYLKDNVQIISWKANTMKTNAAPDEMLRFCRYYLNSHISDFLGESNE